MREEIGRNVIVDSGISGLTSGRMSRSRCKRGIFSLGAIGRRRGNYPALCSMSASSIMTTTGRLDRAEAIAGIVATDTIGWH